jgi:pimeloyl-ACP methyl ester carboxylesterase
MLNPVAADPVERGFAKIAEGQIHFRRVATAAEDHHPLFLLHASPGSSRGLGGLLRALHALDPNRALIAPDMPGNGDSARAPLETPEIAYYAEALIRLFDSIGVAKADLYGTHTGARIACEAAILFPDRVNAVVFDGIGDYDPDTRREILERYAPEITPDDYGRQLIWAFGFVRDMALHSPYYKRDPEHRLMNRAVLPADELHAAAVEVLKSITTYHLAYRAAFRYETKRRLPLLERPALILSPENELPKHQREAAGLMALLPRGEMMVLGAALDEKAAAILRFLDRAA